MGYYSDVALAVRRKDFNRMLLQAKKEPEPDGLLRFLTTYPSVYSDGEQDESVIVLYWSCIKWYEGFRDVDYINAWMNGNYDPGFGYAFIRIGESADDVEQRNGDTDYDLCDYIGISCEITVSEVAPCEVKIPEDDADGESAEPAAIDLDGLLS